MDGGREASGGDAALQRLVPDRLVSLVGGAILLTGVVAIGLLLQESCGDFILTCPPAMALYLVPPTLVYLVALLVWILARRPSPLMLTTVAAGAFFLPILGEVGYTLAGRLLGMISILAPFVVVGSIEALRVRPRERVIAIVVLTGLAAAGGAALRDGLFAAGVGGVGAWLALEALRSRSLGEAAGVGGGPDGRTDLP